VRRADLISGGVLFAACLLTIFVIVPLQIDSGGEDYGLEPKFFPVSLLWLITALSALLVITRLVVPPDPPGSAVPLQLRNWLFVGGMAVFFALAFIAINFAGFIPAATTIIAILMITVGGRRHWIEVIAVSLIAPIVIDLALSHLFKVQLP
jgi:hypothetical protein